MEVFWRNARRTMLKTMDEETGGVNGSDRMVKKGDVDGAIAHLRRHLEEDPEDPDSWYALGKLLCQKGDMKGGYAAFAEGRKYF